MQPSARNKIGGREFYCCCCRVCDIECVTQCVLVCVSPLNVPPHPAPGPSHHAYCIRRCECDGPTLFRFGSNGAASLASIISKLHACAYFYDYHDYHNYHDYYDHHDDNDRRCRKSNFLQIFYITHFLDRHHHSKVIKYCIA